MNVARAGALIVTLGVLGACSSGDEAAPTTTVAVAPTTAPPPTTVPPTTVAPVATAAPTTAPPTTPAPTAPATAPADVEQVRQDVIAAANASFAAYFDALRDPADEAKVARLTQVMTGATLETAAQLIADLVASGRIAVENPDVPAAINIYAETFAYDPAAGTASIEYCRIGSDLGIVPGGNPDGSDQIVVNEVNAYHERSDFVFVDGRWLESSGERFQKFEGATECVRP